MADLLARRILHHVHVRGRGVGVSGVVVHGVSVAVMRSGGHLCGDVGVGVGVGVRVRRRRNGLDHRGLEHKDVAGLDQLALRGGGGGVERREGGWRRGGRPVRGGG